MVLGIHGPVVRPSPVGDGVLDHGAIGTVGAFDHRRVAMNLLFESQDDVDFDDGTLSPHKERSDRSREFLGVPAAAEFDYPRHRKVEDFLFDYL